MAVMRSALVFVVASLLAACGVSQDGKKVELIREGGMWKIKDLDRGATLAGCLPRFAP